MIRAGLVSLVAVSLLVAVGCSGDSDGPSVVATVDGREITGQEMDLQLNQYRQQYASQGVDLDAEPELLREVQSAVLQEMIDQALLLAFAADEEVTASQEEIDAEYEVLVQQVGGEETLQSLLDAQSIERDTLMKLIADEVVLKRLQDHVRAEGGLEVTDTQVEDAYQQYQAMIDDMPPLEQVRPYLRAELEYQQYMEVLPALLEELREGADIEVYL